MINFLGTRIGQASECFVYWKDPMTNDTWGLNFTSPIDAKQFRECCVSTEFKTLSISLTSLQSFLIFPYFKKFAQKASCGFLISTMCMNANFNCLISLFQP